MNIEWNLDLLRGMRESASISMRDCGRDKNVMKSVDVLHDVKDDIRCREKAFVSTQRSASDCLFATLSLFARPPVIVTLYDGGESLLAVGEENSSDFRILQDKGKVTEACIKTSQPCGAMP